MMCRFTRYLTVGLIIGINLLFENITMASFTVKTTSNSYYAKDASGNLIPTVMNGETYFVVGDKSYTFSRVLNNKVPHKNLWV